MIAELRQILRKTIQTQNLNKSKKDAKCIFFYLISSQQGRTDESALNLEQFKIKYPPEKLQTGIPYKT